MKLFELLLCLFILPSLINGQSVTATYGNGDISTNLEVFSPACNGPVTTLTVMLPPGGPYQVTGIDISYNMTAQGGGFKSHQRSQIHFPFSGTTESTVYEGTGDTGGIQSYSRTNVPIANGPYTGGTNLIFEMRAWRTSQGGGCTPVFNKVNNFSWTITVHYTIIPPDGNTGIGTTSPHNSALLELRSVQKGFLLPTMTMALRNAIANPAEGLLIYCTNCQPASIYQYRGSAWARISSLTLEDADGDTKVWVEKITDEDKIRFNIGGPEYFVMNGPRFEINNSGESIFIGKNAGLSDDLSNNANVFIGHQSGQNTNTGWENVAIGAISLHNNTSGALNVAIGYGSLVNNTIGGGNVGIGRHSIASNVSGNYNVAVGGGALSSNSTGISNVAIGSQALSSSNSNYNVGIGPSSLYYNTSGQYNIGIGHKSLYLNTTGNYNTAIGNESLHKNTTGFQNTALGNNALHHNTTAPYNVAIGDGALFWNTSGERNTAGGFLASGNNSIGHSNTAFGDGALYYNTYGSFNTGIGRNAYASASGVSNQTCIGYSSGQVGNNSNTIELGNTSVTWIGGQVGWSTYSDSRIKDNIQTNVPGLSFINKLNPVTYHLNIHRQNEICGIADTAIWEGKYDIEQISQSGFLAQEVEQAAKDINYDFNGITAPKVNSKLYSLQYSAFVVPLVKAVQELSEENNELRAEIGELRSMIESVMAAKPED